MPSQKRIKRSNEGESSQDSSASSSRQQSSQLSQSGRKVIDPSSLNISKSLLKKLINDCVLYLLVADQKKQIIRRADITKNILKDAPKAFPYVINKAERILQLVYGIRLVDVPGKPGYMLVNNLSLKEEEESTEIWPDLDSAKIGLLIIVLATIFMNQNVMEEEVLWETLKTFGLDVEISDHPLFGNVKKLLNQEFVRQLYLEYNTVTVSEQQQHVFCWGPRAHAECSKRALLQLVCEVYQNGLKPEDWTSQYKEIMDEENTTQQQ